MSENNCEKEQPKTIEWYKAQVEELRDIRKAYLELCESNNSDAYFPDLIKEKLQELKDMKENMRKREAEERNDPKHFPKSWGY